MARPRNVAMTYVDEAGITQEVANPSWEAVRSEVLRLDPEAGTFVILSDIDDSLGEAFAQVRNNMDDDTKCDFEYWDGGAIQLQTVVANAERALDLLRAWATSREGRDSGLRR